MAIPGTPVTGRIPGLASPTRWTSTGNNGAFFASSCLLILAGIITALGYTSEAMEVFATMPFGVVPSREIWELRLVVLMVVFVYAFFKFT